MAIGKGLGGYFLNSQSLVADAFHSLTDLVSDFLTLATVSWSLKPPTSRFPSGYGKIESLGSLGVSSLLLAGGIGLGWHSCELLYSQFFLDAASSIAEHDHSHGGGVFGHSHSHNPADMGIPNVHAAWIAVGSIIVKEYLYRASKLRLTSPNAFPVCQKPLPEVLESAFAIIRYHCSSKITFNTMRIIR